MAAAEQKKSYAIIKDFKGIDTKANRTAISPEEFSWLENAQPVGFGNLKIVPQSSNVSISGNTVTFSNTVTYLTSANLNLDDYIVAAESNGAMQYVDLTANKTGNVASAGTFSSANVSVAQYQNTNLIIGDPNKGLFSWDGGNLIAIGSVGIIGITNPGANYTTAPQVIISAPNQTNGTQATAVASITTGSGGIESIQVTNIGSGYTAVPNVNISAPDLSGGTQATAVATISSSGTVPGNVVAISLVNSGSGYSTVPTVTITGGNGSGATATANLSTGIVNAVFLTNAGSGYTSPPTISFVGGNGSGVVAIAQLVTFATGTISVLVTNGGSGYGNHGSFYVTFSGGGGSGANATAIVSGGAVTEVIMNNPGSGYTSTPTVSFSNGTGSNAAGTVILNSNQIVDVATFSGRVWVAAGRTVYASAAGSFTDFTSVSAVAFTLTDSTLHGNIQGLLSANNFLYVFGDDSINVFSDLRVTSTGSTIFTNTNVSASVGTKRIYAIFPYFRSVLFMNDYGIYALVGSTTTKISDPLDGIFPYIDFSKPVSGGQALISNILCACFNFYYTGGQGSSSSSRYVQAVFFEKKWFITSQGDFVKFVTSAPISGKVNLYGCTDTILSQLYKDSSLPISSYIQTALQPMGDSIRTKQALKFGIEATLSSGGQFNVTVDSETGSSPVVILTNSSVTWYNNSEQAVVWTNNSSAVIGWLVETGYYLYKSDAQNYGKYIGLTMTSNNAGFVVNTFEFEHELRVRF